MLHTVLAEVWIMPAWMGQFLGWLKQPEVVWIFVSAYLYIVGCLMFVGLSKLKTGEAVLLSVIWPGFVPVLFLLHIVGSLDEKEEAS